MSYVTAHIGVTLSIKTSSPRCVLRVYESPNGPTSDNFEGYVLPNAPGARCLFSLSLSLCVSLSFDSPLRNIFSSSLHPMKYKTTNPPRTNSNSYFKYLTLVRSTRLSLFDTSRKVVTENSFQVTFFKLFIRYFPFSIRDHFESCLSLEQSSNSERSDIGDRIV